MLDPPGRSIELDAVPFHAQALYQCGPAALATVLEASGVDRTPESLVDEVWLPKRRGAVAVELVAAARRAGRLPYRIDPDLDALVAELEAGRPVLVLQNLGISLIPVWHFAVVIGYDPVRDRMILRSGDEARHLVARSTFERTWARSDRWAMVVLRPGELPARVDRDRLLTAAADAERIGRTELARKTYARWLEREPEDRGARFGLAATSAAQGELDVAAAAYTRLLKKAPDDVPVLNNLALVRGRQGCFDAARTLLATARRATTAPATLAVLADSLQMLDRMQQDAHGDPGAGARCEDPPGGA